MRDGIVSDCRAQFVIKPATSLIHESSCPLCGRQLPTELHRFIYTAESYPLPAGASN